MLRTDQQRLFDEIYDGLMASISADINLSAEERLRMSQEAYKKIRQRFLEECVFPLRVVKLYFNHDTGEVTFGRT
jgi:hypothetical protein